MKKEVILVIVFFILLVSLYNIEQKYVHKKGMEKITSEGMIDTMATVSVSILVDANAPDVIIDSPTNTTYSSGNNIALNYIASDTNGVDSVWYNLDNSENTTLTGNTTFNTNEGSHTLYLFANDSYGLLNDSEFVSFFVSITPPPTGAVAGGSAAAGGGIGEKRPSFVVDQEFLKILVKKNEILKRPIKITNTGNTILDLIIDLQELKRVISVSENSFKLNKDEEKLIDLSLLTGVGVAPGVYVGSILIKAGKNIVKLIKTIIEIESEKVLFDISLNVPLDYKTVKPGNEFVVHSTLINMGGLSNVNINIEYKIENSKGEVVLKDQESVIVGSQASFTKKFLIPKELPLGEYVISAVVSYKDSVGTSSEAFKIGEKEKFFSIFNISVISVILVILILMILWERMGLKNIEKLQKERLSKLVKKRPEMEESEVKKRLEKELKLLGESFEAGYITKTAYDKSKERIKGLLK